VRPAERIDAMVRAREAWSDAQVLDELAALAPLPDEEDPWWGDQAPDDALRFVALGELARARALGAAVPLLLERASYGDFGELMRGLRHRLEACLGDPALAAACVEAMASRRRGTRLWAAHELMILHDPATLPVLLAALDDDAVRVRNEACGAVARIGREHPETRPAVIERLRWYAARRRRHADSEAWSVEADDADEALRELDAS
jgi:HEAT repeat protein